MGTKLLIKNMVCDRCKTAVEEALGKIHLHVNSIKLGEVKIKESNLSDEKLNKLKSILNQLGFELIDNKRKQITEQIKVAIIKLVHYQNDESRIKHSEYLSQKLQLDYPSLSKIFSEEESVTIEQYIIQQKIERVKELITYGELTLSEIAWEMNYSSVAALSSQFKKATGITPSAYKNNNYKDRKTLDNVK